MAKVTQTFVEMDVVKTVKVKVPTFTLELSLEEAVALKALAGAVAGANDVRSATSRIYDALPTDLSIDYRENDMFSTTFVTKGGEKTFSNKVKEYQGYC